jgi:hypothetical protein
MFTFELHNLGRSYRGTNGSAKLRSFHLQGRLLARCAVSLPCNSSSAIGGKADSGGHLSLHGLASRKIPKGALLIMAITRAFKSEGDVNTFAIRTWASEVTPPAGTLRLC